MARTLINTLADRKVDRHPMLNEAGCGGACDTPPIGPARLEINAAPVVVDGVAIDEAEIAREVQHHDGAGIEEARASAARALVIRHLLLRRAQQLELAPEPERDALGRWESYEEALIRQVLDREARPIEPTDAECRRFYESRRGGLPETFETARPVIVNRLMARAWMAASTKYVAQLVRAARIAGLDIVQGGRS